ncbi:hypothetical protein BSL78_26888 [Apostichopus japonicus]|uniref:Uncharacterized protein n=1 Tax=Stichopus japonicus TaxID=307972 RepID=A0A2G8JKL7_STIJA|nr:hypothetical protein BSL78_26888 [Apostichopus japonicus]
MHQFYGSEGEVYKDAEKLDMQQVMRQALADKEQEQSAKQILDAKLTEMQLEVTQRKLAAEKAEEDSEKSARSSML